MTDTFVFHLNLPQETIAYLIRSQFGPCERERKTTEHRWSSAMAAGSTFIDLPVFIHRDAGH